MRKQRVEDTASPCYTIAFPFRTAAKMVTPCEQDSFSSKKDTFWHNNMKVSICYDLEAHRFLGRVNRLRKTLYDMRKCKRETMPQRSWYPFCRYCEMVKIRNLDQRILTKVCYAGQYDRPRSHLSFSNLDSSYLKNWQGKPEAESLMGRCLVASSSVHSLSSLKQIWWEGR